MKKHLLISACLVSVFYFGMTSKSTVDKATSTIIVDNEKLRVVEFVSNTGEGACGLGMHEHEPHLTIILTDGSVQIHHGDGLEQEFDLKAGTTLWSEAEKHEAINTGDEILKVLLVYLKEQ